MIRLTSVAFLACAWAMSATAAPEPYGQNIGNWRITQDMVNRVPICRATYNHPNAIAEYVNYALTRRGDGTYTITVPVRNVARGRYEGASLEVGGSAEPVNATADGLALNIPVDDDMLGRVQRAGNRFTWAINGRRQTGNVNLGTSLGAIVNRLRECTRANGGR